ncbi:hypothetical protein VTK73DRAFT_4945 [Phialemonium thermophilum]|uniref:Secreted protein n=1 Tax=Phialemonium thermophilum TaxID=223376 RepID=A0ABR3WQV3_9PEZI
MSRTRASLACAAAAISRRCRASGWLLAMLVWLAIACGRRWPEASAWRTAHSGRDVKEWACARAQEAGMVRSMVPSLFPSSLAEPRGSFLTFRSCFPSRLSVCMRPSSLSLTHTLQLQAWQVRRRLTAQKTGWSRTASAKTANHSNPPIESDRDGTTNSFLTPQRLDPSLRGG